MSISQRQKFILDILNQRSFVTVQELSSLTFTSASSIRRDLSFMENNGLVKRTHGGVSLPTPTQGVASFYDRAHKNKNEKRLIAKKAATLLRDGQSILLDSSSTAAFLLPHIAKLSSATVFTNNLSTALRAIELGINTHCIGGHAVNGSAALSGTESYKALADIRVDILFFSSQSLDEYGLISDSTEEENYIRQLMIKSARQTVFLCDSEKFGRTSLYRLTDLDNIDFAVFDRPYDPLQTTATVL